MKKCILKLMGCKCGAAKIQESGWYDRTIFLVLVSNLAL